MYEFVSMAGGAYASVRLLWEAGAFPTESMSFLPRGGSGSPLVGAAGEEWAARGPTGVGVYAVGCSDLLLRGGL